MNNARILKRIAALAIIVSGILLVVLANERWLGLAFLIFGIAWFVLQPTKPVTGPDGQTTQPIGSQEPLQWYQSPILWVPVVVAIIGLLVWLFGGQG
ncbi:hypothetical protein [Pseudidiomarina taiwanensis]|uniref:Uncharacterized protein n=1 Tax=Pseudidiomarina taiwanensis TaxID=337250 RepID=A0A432ZMQ4_9GAMM|nr:hypothetical protein [Pseudidiomarina taiwanensis]RUO79169.1 hypothetical protein CWI83_01255 [Pseudidiomarina taiwanensis]